MSSVLRFWRSRQRRHQERERRRSDNPKPKRVLAEATAMYEANAKTMRGNRPGAAKTLPDVKKEDENGVGGTSENKPTKERRNPAREGEGARVKRKRKTSDRKLPKLMTNKQEKKPPAAKGTTLIAPSSLNGVKVKKERKKVLHHVSADENNTTSSILTHIPLKKRRLMMFEEDSTACTNNIEKCITNTIADGIYNVFLRIDHIAFTTYVISLKYTYTIS